jgi:hypothetical protein
LFDRARLERVFVLRGHGFTPHCWLWRAETANDVPTGGGDANGPGIGNLGRRSDVCVHDRSGIDLDAFLDGDSVHVCLSFILNGGVAVLVAELLSFAGGSLGGRGTCALSASGSPPDLRNSRVIFQRERCGLAPSMSLCSIQLKLPLHAADTTAPAPLLM